MKYLIPINNKQALWSWILGILCLVPYVYLPPIGSNTLLYLLNPVIAIPAVILGIIGLRKSREAGGKLQALIGLLGGALLLFTYILMFLLTPINLYANTKTVYNNIFLIIFNKSVGLLFLNGPFACGILAADAVIRAIRSIFLVDRPKKKYMPWIAAAAALFSLVMSLWYLWLWIDSIIHPATLG